MLRPRLAVPIHWGTFYPIGLRRLRPEPLTEPPLEFARLAAELAPEVEVRVLQPGSETELEPLMDSGTGAHTQERRGRAARPGPLVADRP